ncbi:hypothetical protein AB0K15_19660 [Amycolatopsis sp. NPDC049253]|uniref:hypothetical protein n=1 Tax=Amycolatopsis sp. NPDC049253 TaxID=3155274 RepID=UPI00342C7456
MTWNSHVPSECGGAVTHACSKPGAIFHTPSTEARYVPVGTAVTVTDPVASVVASDLSGPVVAVKVASGSHPGRRTDRTRWQ